MEKALNDVDNMEAREGKKEGASEKKQEKTDIEVQSSSRVFQYITMGLTMMFYVLIGGVEDAFPGMITLYAANTLGWKPTQGANLTSLYFGTMALTRLLLIFVSKFVKASILSIIPIVILTASAATLIFAANWHESAIWVCVAMFGVGQGPVFASVFTWVSTYQAMTGKTTCLVTIAYFTGTMTFPPIIGYFLQLNLNPLFPIIMCMAGGIELLICFLYIIHFRRQVATKTEETDDAEEVEETVEKSAENAI